MSDVRVNDVRKSAIVLVGETDLMFGATLGDEPKAYVAAVLSTHLRDRR